MTLGRRHLLGLGLIAGVLATHQKAWASDRTVEPRIPLWPKGVAEAIPTGLKEVVTERSTVPQIQDRAIQGVTVPWLEMVRPTQANGAAIIVMPGGGYRYMAWDKEGPDLAAPIYPAIKIDQLSGSKPQGETLFGRALSSQELARHSSHLNVQANAPPHCLVHAEDDPLVSPDHSLALRSALRARGITVETHLYAKGGHGFGLRNTKGLPLADWPQRLMSFGLSTGWLTA